MLQNTPVKILLTVCVLGALLFFITSLNASETGSVVHVYDGDTISVRLGSGIEKVRLLGIDSPEMQDKKSGVAQCFAKEAKQKTASLLLHHSVTLKKDSQSKNRDVYGRLLRYVFINEKKQSNISSILVEQGYARVYRRSPISQLKDLEKKERDAQHGHRGLWNTKNCH